MPYHSLIYLKMACERNAKDIVMLMRKQSSTITTIIQLLGMLLQCGYQ